MNKLIFLVLISFSVGSNLFCQGDLDKKVRQLADQMDKDIRKIESTRIAVDLFEVSYDYNNDTTLSNLLVDYVSRKFSSALVSKSTNGNKRSNYSVLDRINKELYESEQKYQNDDLTDKDDYEVNDNKMIMAEARIVGVIQILPQKIQILTTIGNVEKHNGQYSMTVSIKFDKKLKETLGVTGNKEETADLTIANQNNPRTRPASQQKSPNSKTVTDQIIPVSKIKKTHFYLTGAYSIQQGELFPEFSNLEVKSKGPNGRIGLEFMYLPFKKNLFFSLETDYHFRRLAIYNSDSLMQPTGLWEKVRFPSLDGSLNIGLSLNMTNNVGKEIEVQEKKYNQRTKRYYSTGKTVLKKVEYDTYFILKCGIGQSYQTSVNYTHTQSLYNTSSRLTSNLFTPFIKISTGFHVGYNRILSVGYELPLTESNWGLDTFEYEGNEIEPLHSLKRVVPSWRFEIAFRIK